MYFPQELFFRCSILLACRYQPKTSSLHSLLELEDRLVKRNLSIPIVQEVYLTTALDQDGIKKAVQRVLGRVP
ncbi:hypothetical protein BHE74_00004351 [Ensete ventricosum]|uniref:Uncharacterized protein n=1 Tax=Ensete ventricosum TaxID=4639 RepID=A0A426YPK5_ENSVE|nr:hypothetical protein B296_00016415 [Ensete ventricosum]RWW86845.1 hypothetical protein BHE74_00004351 [Ensete ventricosum]RZR70595.1 hypothetical protein BHM03_00000687 [Ensete ventricosum]